VAYVGNILLDFDFVTMSRALRVPDETYRRHLYRIMRANIITLTDCLEYPVEYSTLATGLIAGFEEQLGDLSPRGLDAELRETARRVGERLTSREWLDLPGRRPAGRRVKIAEGLYLLAQETVGQDRNAVLVRDGISEEIMAGNDAMEPVLPVRA
jgi:lipoate-protein ligase A